MFKSTKKAALPVTFAALVCVSASAFAEGEVSAIHQVVSVSDATIVYSVSLTNAGTESFSNVRLTPADSFSYVVDSSTALSLDSLPAGATATVEWHVTTSGPAQVVALTNFISFDLTALDAAGYETQTAVVSAKEGQ